jgi:hypothetical protein
MGMIGSSVGSGAGIDVEHASTRFDESESCYIFINMAM